jgi:hypothetical protein
MSMTRQGRIGLGLLLLCVVAPLAYFQDYLWASILHATLAGALGGAQLQRSSVYRPHYDKLHSRRADA